MKNFLFFLISLIVGIGLFVWVISSIGWPVVKEVFLIFSGWQGAIILGLTFSAALVGNWRWQEILKGKNVFIPFFKLLKSYLAGFSIMFLAPVILFGGEVFRSYALKERSGISWQKGASSVLIDRILELTANVFMIFLGVVVFFSLNGFPSKRLAAIFIGVPLFLGGAIFIFYFKAVKKESLADFFLKIIGLKTLGRENGILGVERETFDFFKMNKRLLSKVFILSFLRSGITYLRTLFLVFFLGAKINWLASLAVLGFSYLALLIPIPAALGSHELVQASAFGYLGGGPASAAAFTMVVRGAELAVAFLGIVFLFKIGLSILKNLLWASIKSSKF